MAKNDFPITRVTNLEFTPATGSTVNGLYTPQLSQAEINSIPLTDDRIAAIVFNEQTQELQYLSPAFQWVNVTTDQGEPSFSQVTVLTDIIDTGGTIIGSRPGGSFYTSTPVLINLSTSPTVLTNTTTFGYSLHGFGTGGQSGRIQYSPPSSSNLPASIDVMVTAVVNMTSIGASALYSATLYKNGSAVSTSDATCQVSAAPSNPTVLTFTTHQFLNTNDYLEIWMSSTSTSNNNIAISSMSVTQY
jgi:hypothetical protein